MMKVKKNYHLNFENLKSGVRIETMYHTTEVIIFSNVVINTLIYRHKC